MVDDERIREQEGQKQQQQQRRNSERGGRKSVSCVNDEKTIYNPPPPNLSPPLLTLCRPCNCGSTLMRLMFRAFTLPALLVFFVLRK